MLDGTRGGIGSWTPTATRKRARAAVAEVDAMTPVRYRRRSIRDAVGVTFAPGRIRGRSVLTATLNTEQAVTARAAIERLAWTYRTAPEDHDGGRADNTTLGECRAEALVDLMTANAQVSASATFLVPVNTPQQETHDRALDGLARLLAARGLQLALAPAGQDHPSEWQTRPDDPVATPEQLAALCRGERGEPIRPAADDPAALPPWTPADGSGLAGDPDTVGATAMAQIGDRVGALGQPEGQVEEAAPPGSVLRGHLGPADDQIWRTGHPGDVHVDGVGVINAEAVTGLISALGTDIGRVLVDPRTGVLREHTGSAYRPPERMKRLVQVRDQTCRFPGCTRPAQFTDADHVTPHARGGATTAANLISLCRSHHRAKGSGAWQVALHDDDSITWTTIGGRQCTTWPGTEPAPF